MPLEFKLCNSCNETKPLDEMKKHWRQKGGRVALCKECNTAKEKARYKIKRAEINVKQRAFREANKQKTSNQKKEWYHNNKEYVLKKTYAYRKNRLKNDTNFKLRINLSGRLRQAIKGGFKAGSAVRDLGCSIQELREHLEKQFQPGMSWGNWTKDGWHIDHIKPLSSFDLTDRQQLLEACHYSNLQPLWAKDNLCKSGK